jgi:hypothetical protein
LGFSLLLLLVYLVVVLHNAMEDWNLRFHQIVEVQVVHCDVVVVVVVLQILVVVHLLD